MLRKLAAAAHRTWGRACVGTRCVRDFPPRRIAAQRGSAKAIRCVNVYGGLPALLGAGMLVLQSTGPVWAAPKYIASPIFVTTVCKLPASKDVISKSEIDKLKPKIRGDVCEENPAGKNAEDLFKRNSEILLPYGILVLNKPPEIFGKIVANDGENGTSILFVKDGIPKYIHDTSGEDSPHIWLADRLFKLPKLTAEMEKNYAPPGSGFSLFRIDEPRTEALPASGRSNNITVTENQNTSSVSPDQLNIPPENRSNHRLSGLPEYGIQLKTPPVSGVDVGNNAGIGSLITDTPDVGNYDYRIFFEGTFGQTITNKNLELLISDQFFRPSKGGTVFGLGLGIEVPLESLEGFDQFLTSFLPYSTKVSLEATVFTNETTIRTEFFGNNNFPGTSEIIGDRDIKNRTYGVRGGVNFRMHEDFRLNINGNYGVSEQELDFTSGGTSWSAKKTGPTSGFGLGLFYSIHKYLEAGVTFNRQTIGAIEGTLGTGGTFRLEGTEIDTWGLNLRIYPTELYALY